MRAILVRLSPDSARTKKTIANIIASQKIGRATKFDLFIVLVLLLRASIPEFCFARTAVTHCDPASMDDAAQCSQKKQAKSSCETPETSSTSVEKSNATVTYTEKLAPAA